MNNNGKGKIRLVIISILIVVLILVGIIFFPKDQKNNEGIKNTNKETIKADFVGIEWMRSTDVDTEFINFRSDGTFSYYCSCGNPVNDSDLCEYYTYDKKTKEIEFVCDEETDGMITNVDVIKVTDDRLELSFGGDIRVFEIEEE